MRNAKRFTALVPAAAVFAGLLAISQLGSSGTAGTAAALAAEPPAESPFNAMQQRKEQLEQFKQMNERLARIEAKLDKGINVKVLEMPASAPAPASKP